MDVLVRRTGKLIITACLLIDLGESFSPYAYQPKILIQGGHLEFVGAEDRNITFKTSAGGYVNINGYNLLNLVTAAKEASAIAETLKAAGVTTSRDVVTQLEKAVEGPQGLSSRLAVLEGQVANLTEARYTAVGHRRVNQLSRMVSNLRSAVQRIQSLLNADDCSSSPCQHGGSCEDQYNDVLCRCQPGWEGKFCEVDVNECTRLAGTDLGCQNGATCTNLPGSFQCTCPPGYFGVHCVQKGNECTSAPSHELCGHGVCIPQQNNGRGYTCICDQGWTTEQDGGPACTRDVDECAGRYPACSHDPLVHCVNVPGSFHCGSCPSGFTGNGYYCSDIDECLVNNGGCSMNPYVPCVNTKGSRTCGPCPPGYQGDGVVCTYIGVCHMNNGGCNHLARCIDNPRISQTFVECICPHGYTGNGIGPAGCQPTSGGDSGGGSVAVGDPCSGHPCLNGGSCLAVNHTLARCHCAAGYTGPHCESVVNPCLRNPCQNGGTCLHSTNNTGFTCQCTGGYTGDVCQTQQQACGGTLSGLSGTLRFPPPGYAKYKHSSNCAWLLVTNETKVLNVTFVKFNLEASSSCQFDWLQIHDGRGHGEHMVGRFCGASLPKGGNIVSTHNTLYFWFRSDQSIAQDGFEISWNSIDPVCGGVIRRDSHGTVQSPGSPGKYPSNRDCYWMLEVPLGKRILIQFFTLQIEAHPNCSYDYLEVRDGSSDSSPVLNRFCNSTVPAPLTTSGSSANIHFHSDEHGTDYGFQLSFTVVPGVPGCGGLWTAPTGEISSPSNPRSYRHNLRCEYLIRLPVGDRIKVTFTTFAIEDSSSCSFDYLEIRDGATDSSPLISRLCGRTVPRPFYSSGNALHLLFVSDPSVSLEGFHLTYETLCGGDFTEPSGSLHSPFYPEPYPGSKECIYVISLEPRKAIKLEFQDLEIETTSSCSYDFLEIRDGDNENSPLVGKYCGEKKPPLIISTLNYLWMKFKTDPSVHGRGFLANYTSIDITCGGLLRSKTGVLEAPNHMETRNCTWIIRGDEATVIQLTWDTFVIDTHPSCSEDYLMIYDGQQTEHGNLMGRYCGTSMPPTLITTSNTMTVFLHIARTVHMGFSAQYTMMDASSFCGGTYFTTMGVITSPNYPNDYPDSRDCTWVIQVPYGQQIMLNVTDFEMEENRGCIYDSLEIRNGGYETSPLIGRYCRDDIPRNIPSLANQLYLRFRTDSTEGRRGFQIFWDGTATGCGGTLTSSSGSIISPHYPQPYGESTECFWKIRVSRGNKIQLVIVDLDLEDHQSCEFDYVEIRDGSDSTAALFGKYCNQNHPLQFISTGNSIWVKFMSDRSNQGRGFHLRYVSYCNVELKGYHGVLESPNFPQPYSHSVDCTWVITAPMGNSLNLSFSHFDLEGTDVCEYDYLEISEGATKETASHTFGKYCGNALPSPIASQLAHVFVHMVTDSSVHSGGFRLEWIVNGCGGLLERAVGILSTPGYPTRYPLSTICEWQIRLGYGESIELTVTSYDIESSHGCRFDYMKVYGGPDETSPLLAEFCERKNTPSVFTSSGNNMFLKFVSDSSISGKGFAASYRSVPTRCGGIFKGHFGSIHSKNYPRNYEEHDDCYWYIEVEKNFVVKLQFIEFDVEAQSDCEMDYVKVFDGDKERDHMLLKHCGKTIPSPAYLLSTGNKMLVRMKIGSSTTAKGFLANYTIHCGAHITGEEFGELSFHASIATHTDISNADNCSWIIEAPTSNDHVTLTIAHMDLSPNFENGGECSMNELHVRDGIDDDAPLIGSYCGTRVPPHITSSGSALHVRFTSKYAGKIANFKAFYSVINSACGGELTSEMGAIAMPGIPGSYPLNVECSWTIKTSPGNRASLSFRSFDLEPSENCDKDYVEIRKGNAVGSLVGIYCGNSIPDNITASDKFWIKFRSDEEATGMGFVADYAMLHGNELSGPRGQVASPLYPLPYLHEGEFEWTITVDFFNVISITFEDFYLDKYDEECDFHMQIHDGRNKNSPVLFSGCGAELPPQISSSSNVVYITWNVKTVRLGSWFLLNWIQVPRRMISEMLQDNQTGIIPGCGGFFNVDETGIEFTSPGYPHGYARNMHCEWIFETTAAHHILFVLNDIDFQHTSPYCMYDYIEVYNGLSSDQEWELKETYCLQNATKPEFRGTNLMKVVFKSNYYTNGTGFSAHVNSACGGSLSGSNGVIDMLNTTQYLGKKKLMIYTCVWTITVKRGRTIKIDFDEFDVHGVGDTSCDDAYIMFKNGDKYISPRLGDAKYCGNTIPNIPETIGNKMYIFYKTFDGVKGFKLRFMEMSQSCGGSYTLTQESSSITFSSPSHPQPPPPYTQCEWVFLAPGGEKIDINFFGLFDLTASIRCVDAYVEIRNGGTENSPLIGRYCLDIPDTRTSRENIIYVKFFTDVHHPRNGFIANASLAKCDYVIRRFRGVIKSPGYPSPYPRNLMCKWTIITDQNMVRTLQFDDLDLPSNANCTSTDHVLITEDGVGDIEGGVTNLNSSVPSQGGLSEFRDDNPRKQILGTFCGNTPPSPIRLAAHQTEITFQSMAVAHNNLKGFKLRFMSKFERCGGDLDGAPSGEFSNPGYPNPVPSSYYCKWNIIVPKGRRIRIEIVDLDFGWSRSDCNQRLSFHNGRSLTYSIKEFCGQDTPEAVESSFNKMIVYYLVYFPTNNRGFKLRYTSDLPTVCEGDLYSIPGVITAPSVDNFYCEWERNGESSPNSTFVMTLLDAQIGQTISYDCQNLAESLYIYSGNDLLAEFCGNFMSEIVANPYHSTKVVAQNLMPGQLNHQAMKFNLSYTVHQCGGILTGPHDIITSPNFPENYLPSIDCAWAINYPEGQQIRLKFISMEMEVDCTHDFVAVRNGRTPRSPLIGTFCGNVIPAEIISQSNNLWIWFHSNMADQAKGFMITTDSMGGGCGGIHHELLGEISSPQYPKAYPNNAECVWEIILADGYHIGLTFFNRFQLEQSEDCAHDYVEVFDFKNDDWISIGKVCGRDVSNSYNSTGRKMKVIFRSNEAVTGDGFTARWNANCGGTITSVKGRLISPGYPYRYGRNLNCEYKIQAPGKYITAEFKDFQLEGGFSGCMYDNLTISIGKSRRGTLELLGTYCDSNSPPFIRAEEIIILTFKTSNWQEKRGFLMEYEVESCGGFHNESAIISSPYQQLSFQEVNCTWVIQAPENQVVLLTFSSIHLSFDCYFQLIFVYNSSIIDPNERLARFCGYMAHPLPVVKSTTRNMVVLFTSKILIHSEGFRAAVSFTDGEKSACGGTVTLMHGSTTSIRSPNIVGNDNIYEPFLECHWLIIGAPQESVRLDFKSMDLIPCNITSNSSSLKSCECDFIEIRDGSGPLSELIGTYCGSSTPQPIISSDSRVWLRFTTDSSRNGRGFVIDVSSISSPCGDKVLSVNNATQYLMSPNYPNDYPNNLRCKWLLSSEENFRFDIHFIDLDLEESADCKNDWLSLLDTAISDVITEGLEPNFTSEGGKFADYIHQNSTALEQQFKFCGISHLSDFHSGSNRVEVSFVTNSAVSKRGFKLSYQFQGCNRNFTREQGRITNTRSIPASRCHIIIEAKPNHTISLYFDDFFFVDSSDIGCFMNGIEVRDGLSNDAPVIMKMCDYHLPDPIFSTSSALSLTIWNSIDGVHNRYDMTYTTTDKGRGCGGKIFNYAGRFTSPLYPSDVRNISFSCRWEVSVPEGYFAALLFKDFDLGSRRSCDTEFLNIYEVDRASSTEVFRTKYCGTDSPHEFVASSNAIVVHYFKSVNSEARGWVVKFSYSRREG